MCFSVQWQLIWISSSTPFKDSQKKYDEIKFILAKISYRQHQWIICVNLKMVGFLLGLQGGYTKFPCFLCQGKNRALDKKRLACAQLADSWLSQCSGSSFRGAFQNCVSSSSRKALHHETVCEGS